MERRIRNSLSAWAAKLGIGAAAALLPERPEPDHSTGVDLGSLFSDVKQNVKDHEVVLLAAGLAYYGMLALVPALIALVSIFGLVADPSNVRSLIADLQDTVPSEVAGFLEGQLTSIVEASRGGLGIGAAVAVAAALWTASSGMKALIRGINLVHGKSEKRGFLEARGLAFGVTLLVIVGMAFVLGGITVFPRLVTASGWWLVLIEPLRWLVLFVATVAGLALLYRISPTEVLPGWSVASMGALTAAVLWLGASFGLSVYTSRFASFNETYGTLGAVIVVLLWLFLSGFVVLLGAVIDAGLARAKAAGH